MNLFASYWTVLRCPAFDGNTTFFFRFFITILPILIIIIILLFILGTCIPTQDEVDEALMCA